MVLSRADAMPGLLRLLNIQSLERSASVDVQAFSIAYCNDDPRDVEIYKQIVRANSRNEALKHFVAIKLSEGDFSDYQVLFVQNESSRDLYMFSGQDGDKQILIREGMVAMIHEYFPLPDHLMRAASALLRTKDHDSSEEFMQSLRVRQIHRARAFLNLPQLSDEQAISLDCSNENSVSKKDVEEILELVTEFLSTGVDLPQGQGVVVLKRASAVQDQDQDQDDTLDGQPGKTIH